MKLNGKKRLLLCACLVCMVYSSISFANGTKFLTRSSGEATARANVSFVNGGSNELKDFVGYGGNISGRDSENVLRRNAAQLSIQGNKSKEVKGGKFWYREPLNKSTVISKKNTYVIATLTFGGTTQVTVH